MTQSMESQSQPIKLPAAAIAGGDRVSNFMAADQHGAMRPFYERTLGRPLALLLMPPAETLAAYKAAYDDYRAAQVDILVLVSGDSARFPGAKAFPFLLLGDAQGRIIAGIGKATGLSAGPAYLLLDSNQRLLLAGNGSLAPEIALKELSASSPATSAEVTSSTAPVLIVPNVLDLETCLALIRRWHEEGYQEGQIAAVVNGQQTHQVNQELKKRRDHIIRDEVLTQTLAAMIGRRVAPEMAKAFQFTSGFRFSNFQVVCYDAERGDYFRRHRDSQGPGTGNRMFAMTLNLNSDEYEGGELIFPEYGQQRYKPPRGGAVIFSCPLVHEALPVHAGSRFALLTFFMTLDSKPALPANKLRI
jgi:predicted 2-oxoglutarate/Fe(II)-dependent dioxygenase YbiX